MLLLLTRQMESQVVLSADQCTHFISLATIFMRYGCTYTYVHYTYIDNLLNCTNNKVSVRGLLELGTVNIHMTVEGCFVQ